MSDAAQRFRHVLAGQSFPAYRWELIGTADHYGADARSRRELHALPPGRYPSLAAVVAAVERARRAAHAA